MDDEPRGEYSYCPCQICELKAENARLSAQLESIAGALADAGTVPAARTDGDYAESVRELTRERDRLAALVEWRTLVAWAMRKSVLHCNDMDDRWLLIRGTQGEYIDGKQLAGLPVETPELRTALLAALGEPATAP